MKKITAKPVMGFALVVVLVAAGVFGYQHIGARAAAPTVALTSEESQTVLRLASEKRDFNVQIDNQILGALRVLAAQKNVTLGDKPGEYTVNLDELMTTGKVVFLPVQPKE